MNKILIYAPSITYGGGESYVFNLLNELKKRYIFEVLVITGCKHLKQKIGPDTKLCRVKVVYTSPRLGLMSALGIARLNYEILKFTPDFIFLNGLPESGGLSRYVIGDKNKKITICHSNELWLRNKKNTIGNLIKKAIYYNFTGHLGKIIAINNEVLKSFEGISIGNAYIKKVYSGVPTIDLIARESNDIPVFGRISRLCPGKGNELLLEAFSDLVSLGYNARLVLAGSGEQLNYLKKLVVKLGIIDKVEFLGHVEPDVFFSKIDCMISPSTMEALPTVIAEAMSCKIPVIATNVGGVPEMIEHEFSGFLIEPSSTSEIRKALQLFLECPERFQAYKDNAFEAYRNLFSIETAVTNTIEFLHEKN
ncbi:glycosyltransferase family 4 protein [Vibrio vulnificus]|uniref:glycosyltransferase family 4 protein n=1 Tax=Vibrio vulnificus TaxID=672 RepID=UPI003D7E7C0C